MSDTQESTTPAPAINLPAERDVTWPIAAELAKRIRKLGDTGAFMILMHALTTSRHTKVLQELLRGTPAEGFGPHSAEWRRSLMGPGQPVGMVVHEYAAAAAAAADAMEDSLGSKEDTRLLVGRRQDRYLSGRALDVPVSGFTWDETMYAAGKVFGVFRLASMPLRGAAREVARQIVTFGHCSILNQYLAAGFYVICTSPKISTDLYDALRRDEPTADGRAKYDLDPFSLEMEASARWVTKLHMDAYYNRDSPDKVYETCLATHPYRADAGAEASVQRDCALIRGALQMLVKEGRL